MSKKFFAFICTVFLLLPISISADDSIYLGGDSIGIEIDYDGVMISGTYSFDVNQKKYDPSNDIQVKDIITKVNQVRIHTLDDLYQQLNTYQETVNEIPITVERDKIEQDLTLITVYDTKQNTFRSGLYVKDKIVGVGTMSYYDPSTQTYGALGHEIIDVDLKEVVNVSKGFIYPATVTSIQKAQDNIPGEKHATIDFTDQVGNVVRNTPFGIYGYYEQLPEHVKAYDWAKQEEVKIGQAYMYTVVSGSTIEEFSIQIVKLHSQSSSSIKGIEFVVDDKRLLNISNGIVQGMSGSPIVQDGKIIGAVTHVVTSNPMNGYGVYIEFMLEQSRAIKE